ncbi:MAG: EEP domain-containing protein [Candidatus Tokpelaia sp.]|nr:MAG: EEP domain-containing protein [Candidatus Tokpelaia sp.]KAA6206323.1 MAG: EEP domain-containing protein [Candidatus Tokpelaia sp.]
MAAHDNNNTGPAPLVDLRALRGNLGKTLRDRRATHKAAQNGATAAEAGISASAQTQQTQPLSGEIILASYNIHKCVGTDKIFNPQRIVEVIAGLKADILALQEVDKRFGTRHGLLDLAELERETGLRPVPIHSIAPQGQGWHGNALFFREGNICSIEQIALPGVEPRGALIVDFYFKAGPLRIIAAHFGLLRRSRTLQAEAVLTFLKAKQNMPTVLLGDLNEWRIGKNSSLNRLRDYFVEKTATSPSFPSRFPLLALDRVFAAPHNLVRSLTVCDTPLARRASDHLPIQALICLQPLPEQTQQAETATEPPLLS